jgi:hypothetical protein
MEELSPGLSVETKLTHPKLYSIATQSKEAIGISFAMRLAARSWLPRFR